MGKLYKSLALIALAFFVFSLVIGCGGGSSGGGDGSYVPTYTPTTTPTSSETGTVRGQVFDDSGKPLSNATVTTNVYGTEQSAKAQTTTDSEGKFTLTGIPVGYQQMTVYGNNYSKTLDVQVQQNSIIDIGSIQALPSGAVNGIVVDTNDNPIPFALIELTVEAEIPVPTPTSSPTVTPTTSPTVTPTTSPTVTPTVSPTTTPGGSGKIQGYVEEFLTGVPIEGVTMKLDGTASATTDGSGQYVISDVSSGIHLVSTERSGYYSTNVTVIVENNMTTYYNFILYSTGSFNSKQAGYTMYLYAISDMEGNFSFPFVPDGNYTLRATAYGYSDGTGSTTVESGSSAFVKIILEGDGPGPIPTPTITPTSSPTVTPTSSPSPSPTPTGTLRVVAYGYEDSGNNGEFVSVKHIRVREYGNASENWFKNWPHYSHETPYELYCTGAKMNRYYVVEVEWHNGHTVRTDTTYLDYDGETVWISYYAKDRDKKDQK